MRKTAAYRLALYVVVAGCGRGAGPWNTAIARA
jgi:hypothetical protein